MPTIRKKKRERVPLFQKDPGPWSRLLINWLATLGVIVVFGLVMLFSASYTTGYLRMGDSFRYVRQQGECLVIGIFVMIFMSYVDHRFLRKMSRPMYWVVLALLVLTLFMEPINGCRRWLRFGRFTIQTSELAKFELILLCSSRAANAQRIEPLREDRRVHLRFADWFKVRIFQQLIRPVLPMIPVIVLLVLEPHMSGIVLTVAVIGTILMLTGCGGIFTWAAAAAFLLLLEPAIELAKLLAPLIPYLENRLNSWSGTREIEPQTLQSLYAIGSGGLKGLGLGNSVEKQLWLPESTNDFIFSVVCEELGFIGAVLIILLFVALIVQGLMIAYKAENLYCTMVGIGIMAQVAWQVFCNIAVVTNTIPNTGISLPFFSSGGTILILLLAEMGVMVNIGRNGERAARQRETARAEHEAAKAAREAARKEKTIVLADVRAAREEQ